MARLRWDHKCFCFSPLTTVQNILQIVFENQDFVSIFVMYKVTMVMELYLQLFEFWLYIQTSLVMHQVPILEAGLVMN